MDEKMEIYRNFVSVLEKHKGKRFATIFKHNDSRKNIYTVLLEITQCTPEEAETFEFFTKKRAFEFSNAFLDTYGEEYYWSESISVFYDRYIGSIKKR